MYSRHNLYFTHLYLDSNATATNSNNSPLINNTEIQIIQTASNDSSVTIRESSRMRNNKNSNKVKLLVHLT